MAEELDDDLPITPPPEQQKPTPVWLLPLILVILIPAVTYFVGVQLIIPIWEAKTDERAGHGETIEAQALRDLANIKKFDIPELITNLSHVDGRYIRVGFTLEGTHPMFDDIVKPNAPRIKSVTIGILQTLTMQDVREGSVMNRVRHDLVEHINRALEPAPHVIENLYFSEFVIQ